ncbi:MAG: primosomal protein N' [Chloroflexi bacterium]|nr:primosomal protein N' [Chloroflexota bacterium]
MLYAEVAVNVPATQSRTFSYSVPDGVSVTAGQAVWVPFGPRRLQGIVFELTPFPAVTETREIAGLLAAEPVLSPIQLQLARWMGDYYLAPLFSAASLMLPPGFERRTITFLHLGASELPAVTPAQRTLLNRLQKHETVTVTDAEKLLGKKGAALVIGQLVRRRLITRSFELERPRIGPRIVQEIHLSVASARAREEASRLRARRAPRQAEVLEYLASEGAPVLQPSLLERLGCSSTVIDALSKAGLVAVHEKAILRDPIAHRTFDTTTALELTPYQAAAWHEIRPALIAAASEGKRGASTFLLHGITGSGKTELYLRALADTVSLGRRGIVLVPEIALTPQTIERFASRFPGKVAVLHSRLSPGEQFDEWQRIRQGDFDVVIGSRSAIFAPQPNLGLIVIDEEHEWTYKQQDHSPHYHAREVALKLAELVDAVVLLGSATPDVESYYRAHQEEYRLLRIPERVYSAGQKRSAFRRQRLPDIEVVDLRQELRAGNRSIFSRSLDSAIRRALAVEEQIILFLNRRGTAPVVQCRHCGHVMRCRRCNISLTYHTQEAGLICHLCNYRAVVPDTCPNCWSHRIKFLGIGTQKVEEEAAKAFPEARLLRWDSDVTKRRRSHEDILRKFSSHQSDILIGTQMIAKGLDLPLVTVVGVVSADVNLHLPDFRSAERTFQLLTQVAGRAGRSERGGKVIVQTYTPEHYAIATASRHDYVAFYEREIHFRQEHGDPPFRRLARLIFAHTNANYCRREAENMYRLLKEERDSSGMADVDIIGAAPTYFERLRGKFRWQVVVRADNPNQFLSNVRIPLGWTVDVDTMSLL